MKSHKSAENKLLKISFVELKNWREPKCNKGVKRVYI